MNTSDNSRLITVTGRGGLHAVPDITRVELSLVTLHDTYKEAYDQAKTDTDRLSDIMQGLNLSKKLPKTTRFDISKKTINEYDVNNNFTGEKFLGFKLDHDVKIDLGMDNVLLNKVIQEIGKKLKQAEINIGYTVKDPRPFQLKILERAVKDAREKAQIMADAAGCKLGKCLSVNYSVQELHIYSQARSIHDAGEALCCNEESLDITPDDLDVSDTVTVEWELEDKQ